MEIFLIFALVSFLLASLILPWVNLTRIQIIRSEMNGLKLQLNQIFVHLEKSGIKLATDKPDLWQQTQYANPTKEDPIPLTKPKESVIVEEEPMLQQGDIYSDQQAFKEQKEKVSFEQHFGARLPVWVGGVSLAFAGFFMIKYSIETGLLNPLVRIILGLLFGVGLLYAANWVRRKPQFANGIRIAQALTGAGIAELYVCLFAATSLYNLIPTFLGFTGMAAITAIAVILSLRHGMPIALLGMLGGLLTPALVGTQNAQASILFIYLYFVLSGLMVVIRRQYWWPMAPLAVVGAFVWVCLWLFGGNFIPGDGLCLSLFLIAISATVTAISKEQYAQESAVIPGLFKMTSVLNYLTLAGSLLLTGIIAAMAGFTLMEWGLFALLSLGGVGLAYFNPRLYGFVPWLSMAVNAVMFMVWDTTDTNAYALTITLFGSLYIVAGHLLQSRSEKPLIWAGLTSAVSIVYYLLGYCKLRGIAFSNIPLFWGLLAFIFVSLSLYGLINILRNVPKDHSQKQHLLAIYAITCTAFLSLALTIELQREFLSVAFAAQLFAIAWINTKVDIKALRAISGVLACVFGFLLTPQILLLAQLMSYSLVEAKLVLQKGIPIVNWPIFQLGVPALFFIVSSYLLRAQKDDKLVRALEYAAITLIGLMGYYLTRHVFHIDENILFVKAGFFERGVITNILFVYGLLCLWIGKRFERQAVYFSGLVISSIAIFRICYFDVIIYNPLWSTQSIGKFPIFNALLLTYGLSIAWIRKIIQELQHVRNAAALSRYAYALILLLSFIFVSLNVRQMYHGTFLNGHEINNAEIYTYSAVWLLFGIVLLFFGVLRKDKMIRLGSLLVMILTVAKVFLYDAAELEGLLRVLSFFGLGLSLLGLSWFYTRFVFANPNERGCAL